MNKLRIWWESAFEWRYYLLLTALILLIIMPGFFDQVTNDEIIWPLNRTILLLASLNMIRKMNRGMILIASLGLLATGSDWLGNLEVGTVPMNMGSLWLFGLFIGVVTYENFHQMLRAKEVDLHLIVGAFNGFLLIGVIGGLIYSAIHISYPSSFDGVMPGAQGINDLVYFSYITVLTIGYGDITPVTDLSRRISIFLGLIGQFYLVVIMAVLVGKYLVKPRP